MKQQEAQVTAAYESVVCLDAPEGPLVGILTRPAQDDGREAVLLCPGGWFGTMTNRNRVYVRLARRLASLGYAVFRFDWRGVGESTGEIDSYELDQPFTSDVVAAVRHLEAARYANLTVVGVCFGARSALAAAQDTPSLRDLVLVSFPVPAPEAETKWTWQGRQLGMGTLLRAGLKPGVIAGLFDPRMRRMYRKAARAKWRAMRAKAGLPVAHKTRTTLTPTELLRQLEDLDRRGVSVHFLYGEADMELNTFRQFSKGPLEDFIQRPDSLTSVEAVPGQVHAFDTLAAQDVVIDRIAARVRRGHGPS